jgi:hypothetical protein
MFVLVYVDDIIITASVPAAISNLLQQLPVSFAVKDLGKFNYFLDVEVVPLKSGLLLSQRRYILDSSSVPICRKLSQFHLQCLFQVLSQHLMVILWMILCSIVVLWDLCNIYLSHVLTWPLQ